MQTKMGNLVVTLTFWALLTYLFWPAAVALCALIGSGVWKIHLKEKRQKWLEEAGL